MGFRVAFVVLVAVRLASALVNGLNDCDEVYNYWEAVALVAGRGGMQTWEYAFGLRSWSFVLPFGLAARALPFALLRFVCLGVPCSLAEAWLVAASPRPRTLLALLATSPGVFQASTALLPSAVAMTLSFAHHAAWMSGNFHAAVFAAVAAVLWSGWPFVALLFAPFFLASMVEKPLESLKVGMKAGLVIGIPVLLVDVLVYGRLVSPLFNLLAYNLEGNDQLYGVAPASFYLKNLVLNCNLAMVGISSPSVLWFSALFARPHKEERFTFPAYPVLYYEAARRLPVPLVPVAALLGVSRIAAVTSYYSLPQLRTFQAVATLPSGTLCLGAEWHRYTSTLTLPESIQMRFVKSDFLGQLPRPWLSSDFLSAARADRLDDFNVDNIQHPDSLVPLSSCDYLVDFHAPSTFKPVHVEPFLDAARTPTLARALWIPFYSSRKAHFANLTIFEKI